MSDNNITPKGESYLLPYTFIPLTDYRSTWLGYCHDVGHLGDCVIIEMAGRGRLGKCQITTSYQKERILPVSVHVYSWFIHFTDYRSVIHNTKFIRAGYCQKLDARGPSLIRRASVKIDEFVYIKREVLCSEVAILALVKFRYKGKPMVARLEGATE